MIKIFTDEEIKKANEKIKDIDAEKYTEARELQKQE